MANTMENMRLQNPSQFGENINKFKSETFFGSAC